MGVFWGYNMQYILILCSKITVTSDRVFVGQLDSRFTQPQDNKKVPDDTHLILRPTLRLLVLRWEQEPLSEVTKTRGSPLNPSRLYIDHYKISRHLMLYVHFMSVNK